MAGSGTSTTTVTAGERELFAALDALEERYGSGSGGRSVDDSLDQALDEVAAAFELLMAQLGRLPESMELSRLTAFGERIAARRLVVAARVAGSTGDGRTDRRRCRDALGGGSGSSRTAARDAKRAAALGANKELGDAVGDGSVTPDAIDSLTKAADAGTGEVPSELVAAVGGLTADQTADVVEQYLEDRVDVDEVEERYAKQMEARAVRRYRASGLAGIAIEGPDQVIDTMWAQLNAAADSEYRADGGRDTPVGERKSLDHRRFDAAQSVFAGQSTGVAGGRPSVVITLDGDRFFTEPDSRPVASQLGSGPLPVELVDEYLKTSPLSVLIRGTDGSPLWLGRTRRRASDQQFLALAVRDRGCVLCRATIDRCVAHHLMPWTAPGRGTTNIDQMALLCQRCHNDLHHRNHTLHRTRTSAGHTVWTTRPATPNETPKRKPPPVQRE